MKNILHYNPAFISLSKISGTASYILLATLFMLSSCSDEFNSTIDKNERIIKFNVSEATSDQNDFSGHFTRSEEGSLLRTVPFESGNLFLVPIVEETVSPDSPNGNSTKAISVNENNIDSFGVFAGYSSDASSSDYVPSYIYDEPVRRSTGWLPDKEYLWPGNGSLHFNAYSPYKETASEGKEGIVSLNKTPGDLSLDFSVPQNVSDQIDLLYSTPIDASTSPCPLVFNHALTAIRFVAGAELYPCTVKSITLSGLSSSGRMHLETGEWTDLSPDSASFSVSPAIKLEEAAGTKYVAPGTPISPSDDPFMLIPATLGENATVTITFESNGKETVTSASISGQKWPEGKSLTYRISANPNADSLILDVTGDFETEYTGSTKAFNVKSSFNKDSQSLPVEWIAEFVDDNGEVISSPSWISEFTTEGKGNTDGYFSTKMQDIILENMTSSTRNLQQASDINASSGYTPYNLSSTNGNVETENTANTYIISSPGKYSFPLVYGNAIKNGTDNKGAYTASTHRSGALKNFINHLGAPITSPYIYSNQNCEPEGAYLVWEDELNLIRNVSLSEDKKSIVFDVPHNTIRQGNALIAVKDKDGKTMWSWHIWVTDFQPATESVDVAASGHTYSLWSKNLGYISAGDVTRFPEVSVNVRFTQINVPEGTEPLSKTVTIHQNGALFETPECNTYYQWGRKDPMMSSMKQWYNAAHQEIEILPTADAEQIPTSEIITSFILHPEVFYTATHEEKNETPYPYLNLWNVNYNTANIKSVYDPSPVGYVVPESPVFTFLGSYTSSQGANVNTNVTVTSGFSPDGSENTGYYVNLKSSGESLFFPGTGYRSGETGNVNPGNVQIWTSHALSVRVAGFFGIDHSAATPLAFTRTDPLFHGFSIRPIKE